jgi:SAM-dependent methyltransferase
MFKKWATDEKLHCLDLGGRFNSPEGYISVDLQDADVVMDLSTSWHYLKDNSVGVLRAYHVLEHLPDTIHFFNEAFRVLAPGGLLLIEVPSSNGLGAFSDPTHIKFFNQLSFEYYTNEQYARFIRPQYKGRFQRSRIAEFNWDSEFGPVPIVSVQMICLKGWYDTHYCGEKKC